MATLSSSSTIQQIKDAYDDNASYEEDNDVAKAKIFVTACRMLLMKIPKLAGHGGGQVAMSPDLIRKELADARTFLQANDTSTSARKRRVLHPDLSNYRY